MRILLLISLLSLCLSGCVHHGRHHGWYQGNDWNRRSHAAYSQPVYINNSKTYVNRSQPERRHRNEGRVVVIDRSAGRGDHHQKWSGDHRRGGSNHDRGDRRGHSQSMRGGGNRSRYPGTSRPGRSKRPTASPRRTPPVG